MSMTDLEMYAMMRRLQKEQKKKINDYRKKHNVRCKNCKAKMRPIKNDFKHKTLCKTCWKARGYERENRQDIYILNDKGKWVKQKYKKDNWWYLKI